MDTETLEVSIDEKETTQHGYFDIRAAVLSAIPLTVNGLLDHAHSLALDNESFADKLYNPQPAAPTQYTWRKLKGIKYPEKISDGLESNIVWHTLLLTLNNTAWEAWSDANYKPKDEEKTAVATEAEEYLIRSHGTGIELLQLALQHLTASVLLRKLNQPAQELAAARITNNILPFLQERDYLRGHNPKFDKTGITSILLAEADLIAAVLEITQALIHDSETQHIPAESSARVKNDARVLHGILLRAKAGYERMEGPYGINRLTGLDILQQHTPAGAEPEDIAIMAYTAAKEKVQQQELDPLISTLKHSMSSVRGLMHYVRTGDAGVAFAALERAGKREVLEVQQNAGEEDYSEEFFLDDDGQRAHFQNPFDNNGEGEAIAHEITADAEVEELEDEGILSSKHYARVSRDSSRDPTLITLPSPLHVATVIRAARDSGILAMAIPALEKLRGAADGEDGEAEKRGGGPWSKAAQNGLPAAMAMLRELDAVALKAYSVWLTSGAAGSSKSDTERKLTAYQAAPVSALRDQMEDYREDIQAHLEAIDDCPDRIAAFYATKGYQHYLPVDEEGEPLPDWLSPKATSATVGLDYKLVLKVLHLLADIALTAAD